MIANPWIDRPAVTPLPLTLSNFYRTRLMTNHSRFAQTFLPITVSLLFMQGRKARAAEDRPNIIFFLPMIIETAL